MIFNGILFYRKTIKVFLERNQKKDAIRTKYFLFPHLHTAYIRHISDCKGRQSCIEDEYCAEKEGHTEAVKGRPDMRRTLKKNKDRRGEIALSVEREFVILINGFCLE